MLRQQTPADVRQESGAQKLVFGQVHLQFRRPEFDLWVGKIPWKRVPQ